MSWQMENEQPSVMSPTETSWRSTSEDNPADSGPPPQSRSTDRPAHTPRDVRNGDHPSRPGTLPPVPGRLPRLLAPWVPLVLLALLLAISWQVAGHGPLLRIDDQVRDAIARTDGALPAQTVRPAADHIAQLLSDLGGSLVAIPFLLACSLLSTWRSLRGRVPRWWLPVAAAALTSLLIPLLVVPAKAYFARPGPDGLVLLPDQWGWYPSGHTATAAIAYGTSALLLARATVRSGVRTALRAGALLLGTGVGAGLMWCDYHWFLDVVASWCLSGLVLWTLGRLLPRLADRG